MSVTFNFTLLLLLQPTFLYNDIVVNESVEELEGRRSPTKRQLEAVRLELPPEQ